QTAKCWMNGAPTFLDVSPTHTTGLAVAVNSLGQPVVAGNTGNNPNDLQMGYWSGVGDRNILSAGEYVSNGMGITIDASDNVYVCGSQFNTVSTPPALAWYWQITPSGSTTAVQLSSGSTDATAHAITLGQ